jgi:hypothetical protein
VGDTVFELAKDVANGDTVFVMVGVIDVKPVAVRL